MLWSLSLYWYLCLCSYWYLDQMPRHALSFLQGVAIQIHRPLDQSLFSREGFLCSLLLPVWDTMPPLVRFLLSFIIARSQTRAGHMKRTLSKWFVPFLLTRLIFSIFSRLKLNHAQNVWNFKILGIKMHFWNLGRGRKRSFGRQSMVWWRRMWNVGRRMTRRNPACGRLTLGTWLDFVFINTSVFFM